MDVSDIHILLKSRADSNRRGKEGPMSGEVIDLCYVCLSTLSLAKDPESIPVIVPLLNDPSDTVRQWSGIALKAIGESDVTLQKKIDEMKKRQNLEQESGQVRK
jgi:HEAT repeat protein